MTLEEIREYLSRYAKQIQSEASAYGRDPKIYMHWTAGSYDTDYPDYHSASMETEALLLPMRLIPQ